MSRDDYQPTLEAACALALKFLDGVGGRAVGRPADYPPLLAEMGGPLPEEGVEPLEVIERLHATADPGILASTGPRYFGFVIGGAVPAAIAADWLTAAWDQNAFGSVMSPAAAAAEEISRGWLNQILGLPDEMALGFTTGATMANFTCLAAARHALLAREGWNVEERGLYEAPRISVIVSDESHITIFAALQMLGLGRERVVRVPTDEQGRMRAAELRRIVGGLATPFAVCAQAGNVNTGAFDPLTEIAAIVHEKQGWLHIDGAFGAWAAASPEYAPLVRGMELTDSLTVDAHKWLNVPYDSGFAFVRDAAAHHAAMTLNAPYYAPGPEHARDNHNWVPEASRRARGFPVYAAIRSLGRAGIRALIERNCSLARRMAEKLRHDPRIAILNDIVLNQVLVRFTDPAGGTADAFTAAVIRRVQEDGTCWAGGTTWHGMHAMRISIANWSTTESDIDRSAEAIVRCAHQ